jgi:hypothetical protein
MSATFILKSHVVTDKSILKIKTGKHYCNMTLRSLVVVYRRFESTVSIFRVNSVPNKPFGARGNALFRNAAEILPDDTV